MSKSAISKIAFVLVGCILVVFAASLALSWRQNKRAQMRATALPVTIKQAQSVMRAIERYNREQGTPPQSLSVLVPKYIQQLPDAGPAAKNGWRYETGDRYEEGGWALSIRVRDEYSPNIMGFGDTFVFHPSGKYPNAAYGGGFMPFGKWGYYVE